MAHLIPLSTCRPAPRRRATLAAICTLACAGVAACATTGPDRSGSAAAVERARVGQICATVIRLSPGEAQYEGCVSSLAASARSLDPGRAAPPPSAEGPGASRSYFFASSDEVLRREQLSCARLGLDPANGAYTYCVANLAATLATIDAPAG